MNLNDINIEAKEILRKRRSKAIQNAEYNRQCMLKNEEFMLIENNIGNIIIEIAKKRINNESSVNLEKEMLNLEERKKKLLSKYNLSISDLEPKYYCKLCQDKGVYEGKYCSCFNSIITSLIDNQNIGSRSGNVTFEDCDKIDKNILDLMRNLTIKYPKNNNICNVYITGSVGTGKTTLTQAVANAFKSRNLFTIFIQSTSLNKCFLDYHKTFNEDKSNYLDSFLQCNVLIIDDLGTETMLNNVTKEYLLLLINERIIHRKLTIISSNLSNEELVARYGERLFSRLFDKSNSLSINIKGKDLRLKIS